MCRGAYDKSLQIIVDLLELNRDCTVGCQLSHQSIGFFKVASCVSLNPGINMAGIVGFYDFVIIVDLLLFLFTENFGKWADFSGICSLN